MSNAPCVNEPLGRIGTLPSLDPNRHTGRFKPTLKFEVDGEESGTIKSWSVALLGLPMVLPEQFCFNFLGLEIPL